MTRAKARAILIVWLLVLMPWWAPLLVVRKVLDFTIWFLEAVRMAVRDLAAWPWKWKFIKGVRAEFDESMRETDEEWLRRMDNAYRQGGNND